VGSEGGTESYLARVIPELARAGIAVTLRARRVIDAHAFGVVATPIAWSSDSEPPSAPAAAEVAALLEGLRPDLVLLSNVFDAGVMRAARAAARAFVRVHDHRLFCPHGDRVYPQFRAACSRPMGYACLVNAVVHGCVEGVHAGTLRRLRAREVLRDAVCDLDGVVVSSQFMAELCAINGVARERIVVAPPPVSDESLALPPAPMPVERRLLFAGRLVRDKGLRSLVRALARIPASVRPLLDVAGAATAESRSVEVLAARLGVGLRLLGRLDPAGVLGAMDEARAVAMPSLWPEPFGLVGIEAFARGRPVVAYAAGGIPEWLGGGGIAVAPGDEAGLAGAVVEVLDEGRWKDLAGEGRRQATRYTPRAHVASLLQHCFSP
jgi:glycosyltransferase involved in cell wall biosynthesis